MSRPVGRASATYGQRLPSFQKGGYLRVYAPEHPLANVDGQVLVHRKVLHDAGIVVPRGSHVHHKNHDKTDNRVENLEVLTAEEHNRRHQAEETHTTNQYGTWEKGALIGVMAKVPPDLHAAWKAAAAEEGRTMAALLREVLAAHLGAKAER